MRTAGSVSFQGVARQMEACVRAEQGRLEDARAGMEAALRNDREHGLSPDSQGGKPCQLAQILLAMGRKDQAAASCRKELKSSPGVEFSMQVACVLARAGQPMKARHHLP